MYAGDNCTNYVAFVESTVYGVVTPTFPLGDAGGWPVSAPRLGALVDHTPTVGSVAEWNGGSPGIPSPGHVAVVEAVGPHASYIVVSQQNVQDVNDYDWMRIDAVRGANQWEQWPSSFIHFPRVPKGVRVTSGTRFQWVSVRVVPARFQSDALVFNDGVDRVVTPGQPVSLVATGRSSLYRIGFLAPTLQARYTLHVADTSAPLVVLDGLDPDPRFGPRVRVVSSGAPRLTVVTLTVRPRAPITVAAESPAPDIGNPTTTTSLVGARSPMPAR